MGTRHEHLESFLVIIHFLEKIVFRWENEFTNKETYDLNFPPNNFILYWPHYEESWSW